MSVAVVREVTQCQERGQGGVWNRHDHHHQRNLVLNQTSARFGNLSALTERPKGNSKFWEAPHQHVNTRSAMVWHGENMATPATRYFRFLMLWLSGVARRHDCWDRARRRLAYLKAKRNSQKQAVPFVAQGVFRFFGSR